MLVAERMDELSKEIVNEVDGIVVALRTASEDLILAPGDGRTRLARLQHLKCVAKYARMSIAQAALLANMKGGE